MSWIKTNFSDNVEHQKKRRKVENEVLPVKTKTSLEERTIWKNRWKPKNKDDLVIHKKKIEEVENWLEFVKKGENSSILLITGPPGCGKQTTLKVLCSKFGINLIEWIPQIHAVNFDSDNINNSYQSDIRLFEEFVVRATRYSNVLSSQSSRLITIKDIPNGYLKDNTKFHQFLDSYSKIERLYLVFITTDFNITRDLFNNSLKFKHNVKTISFNPVTERSVKTALQKIANGRYSEYIDEISVSCNGDLRNAITTLEFLAVKGTTKKLPQKRGKKNVKNDNKISQKEETIDLFRGLGRVLYAKRENGALSHCPVYVGDSFTSSPELFVGMLQENYLNTFSSIHEAAKAAHKLSVSNNIISDYKDTMTSRSLGTILASFGLMHFNSKPIKKFQQFDKPRKATSVLADMKTAFTHDRENLSDLVFYGKKIPTFSSENKELLSKCVSFK